MSKKKIHKDFSFGERAKGLQLDRSFSVAAHMIQASESIRKTMEICFFDAWNERFKDKNPISIQQAKDALDVFLTTLREIGESSDQVYLTLPEVSEHSEEISEQELEIAQANPEAIVYRDFEDAMVGVVRIFNKTVVAYDYRKCIDVLVETGDCDFEQAQEWLEHNTLGTYAGENTPAFVVYFDENEFGENIEDPVGGKKIM